MVLVQYQYNTALCSITFIIEHVVAQYRAAVYPKKEYSEVLQKIQKSILMEMKLWGGSHFWLDAIWRQEKLQPIKNQKAKPSPRLANQRTKQTLV